MKVYGIKNCDKVKRQLKELDAKNMDYEFIDLKKFDLTKTKIKDWKKHFGDWPINPKGRIYKQIADEFQAATDAKKCELIIENTSALIRPIFEGKSKTVFDINEL